MSDDIVARLRWWKGEITDLFEAADEIERLRVENERLRKGRDEEIERADILRDAIKYAVEVRRNYSADPMRWLDDWFYGELDAMRDLEEWRAKNGGRDE